MTGYSNTVGNDGGPGTGLFDQNIVQLQEKNL